MTAPNKSPLPPGEGQGEGHNLLTTHLPLLAGAPNGIKKLRELILELAVRGKLVPQDPSDEPASELLKRIAEEKARLVAEGKIKKQKPLPDIDEAALPFELPAAWVWTRLGEITNFGTTTKKDEIPDDAWVLDLEDIEKDTSRLLQKARFKERNSLSDKNSVTKGDVLYGKLRPYLNKVLVAEEDGFCTTEILPFRCYGPFVAHYFMLALKSPYFLSYVNTKSYGMKMPRLGTEDGRQAYFPLPPLAEQHRIVAKVDELMALCDRLEAQQADADSAHAQLVQALLDSLTQARDAGDFAQSWQRLAEHFHTLFTTESSIDALKQTLLQLAVMGKLVPQDPSDEPANVLLKRIAEDKTRLIVEGKIRQQKSSSAVSEEPPPFELPTTWAWANFGDLSTLITSGSRGWNEYYSETGSTFIRSQDIKTDKLNFENRAFVTLPVSAEGVRTRVQFGDILITITGANVAKAALVEDYLDDAYVSQHVALIRLAETSMGVFIHKWLVNSHGGRRLLLSSSYGAKPGLNLNNIRDLLVPIPPLAEQHRIVAKVDQLMTLCDQLKARLNQARQMHEQLACALVEQAVA